MQSKPLCWVPYYSLETTARQVTLCCKMAPELAPKFSIDEYHSPRLDQIRRELFELPQELTDLCRACKGSNNFTRQKIKHREYQEWSWPEPKSAALKDLHIALDNVCASSCTMCNPNLSHSIARLVKDLDDVDKIYPRWRSSEPTTLQNLDSLAGLVSELEVVHVFGGEPLISPQWPRLIELLKSSAGRLKKITLNTGMKKIKESSIEQLVNLDSSIEIDLLISLDGPMDLNQWIRGCSESEFAEAYAMLIKHRSRFNKFAFQSVLGAFNIWALPEWNQCVQELSQGIPQPGRSISTIWDPLAMSPWQLPDELKTRTKIKLEQALNTRDRGFQTVILQALKVLQSQPAGVTWEESLKSMSRLPKLRGETTTLDFYIEKYLR